MRSFLKYLFVFSLCFLTGCNYPKNAVAVDEEPPIFPDYVGVTIPRNLAPITFTIKGAERIYAEFSCNGKVLKAGGKHDEGIQISKRKWKSFLQDIDSISSIQVIVSAEFADKGWITYSPFKLYVAKDDIDEYIVYRLLKPGYEESDRMGIYQRDITSFDEYAVIENENLTSRNDYGCVNCHSFCAYNADSMMYHGRIVDAGTVVIRGEHFEKVNLKIDGVGKGAYPRWHPHGRYIACSMNDTHQVFHVFDKNRISGFDFSSDLMLFDVENNEVVLDKRFLGEEYYETFPAWSPDGKWLYFSRADYCGELPDSNVNMHYGIYRVSFDEVAATLGEMECVVDEHLTQKSQLFARISPDGRYLLYTECKYGMFPLSLKDSQLKMVDLSLMQEVDISAINSDDVESYHAWSSNGKWIMFSSRRMDGLYSRVYFAYFDKNGVVHKPFLLPQRTADFDLLRMMAYNVPEFTKNRIRYSQTEVAKMQKRDLSPIKVRYNE